MKPAPFQIAASDFVFERDASMVFARVGSGKTYTYLDAIRGWIEDGTVKRVLVTAPLRVCNLVWRQEIEKWGLPLTVALLTGEMTKLMQYNALHASTDILLVNHDMAAKIIEEDHGCDALVIDELSKFRNPTGKRQKAIRRGSFKIRSGGTGTPAPNRLTSIFGMCHAVGLGHLVGRNYDRWLRNHFYPTNFDQTTWEPFADTPDALAAMIAPNTYVLESDAVDLPPVVSMPIEVDLPTELRRTYDRMRAESQLSDLDIVAGSAGTLFGKLRQVGAGFVYRTQDQAKFRLDPFRLEALSDLVGEMQGRPLIVAYEFREQLAMLQEKWPFALHIGAGSTGDQDTIDRWRTGSQPVLLLHPASAGHGLNGLEEGGDAVAWMQPTPDYELYEQVSGRLSRRAQKSQRVWSYELVGRGTVDESIVAQRIVKAREQDGLWASLRR